MDGDHMWRWAAMVFLGAALAEGGVILTRSITIRRALQEGDGEEDESDQEVMVTRCPMCRGGAMVEVRPHQDE